MTATPITSLDPGSSVPAESVDQPALAFPPPTAPPIPPSFGPDLFLCVDGGGTSVKVVICSLSGVVLSRGMGGPCNV